MGGAYFTDSVNLVLYQISIAGDGALSPAQTITLSGPASATLGVFNLNRIEATANGDTLIVAHNPLGAVFTVGPADRSQPADRTDRCITGARRTGRLLLDEQ